MRIVFKQLLLTLTFCALLAVPESSAESVGSLPPALEYKYIGNTFSNKFHRPWCPFGKVMNIRHAIFFHFRKDAIAAGYEPCRYCLPPVQKKVTCVLLKSPASAVP